MAASTPITTRLLAAASLAAPGMAVAHGRDHLHFWGSHGADGQAVLLGGALLGLAAIGAWLWQKRR